MRDDGGERIEHLKTMLERIADVSTLFDATGYQDGREDLEADGVSAPQAPLSPQTCFGRHHHRLFSPPKF